MKYIHINIIFLKKYVVLYIINNIEINIINNFYYIKIII